ncbi:hypothetical protein OG436_39415 (plasmid) [Streptomyces caniferus]|uniref:hypothetical protein n=1 Tax=Streptomyces caniferus TaxID=285557 RepID=UPI002E2CCE6D|nr:hypothetical protein [Streptomyces caniferus]
MTVTGFHRRLTPDHFHDQHVPPLRKLRDLLSGEELPWELVEAAADVCFPGEPATQTQDRLAPLRELWDAAQTAPTAVSGDALPSVARELLEAKDRTIAAYQEIDRARQAFQGIRRPHPRPSSSSMRLLRRPQHSSTPAPRSSSRASSRASSS